MINATPPQWHKRAKRRLRVDCTLTPQHKKQNKNSAKKYLIEPLKFACLEFILDDISQDIRALFTTLLELHKNHLTD